MKIFIVFQAILVSVAFAQDFVNIVIPSLAGTRIVNNPGSDSSHEKCDCKCDSYTFTDSNGGIWGNCQRWVLTYLGSIFNKSYIWFSFWLFCNLNNVHKY